MYLRNLLHLIYVKCNVWVLTSLYHRKCGRQPIILPRQVSGGDAENKYVIGVWQLFPLTLPVIN